MVVYVLLSKRENDFNSLYAIQIFIPTINDTVTKYDIVFNIFVIKDTDCVSSCAEQIFDPIINEMVKKNNIVFDMLAYIS